MEGQVPAASALQLSTFTKIKSIPVAVRLTAPGADQPVHIPVDVVVAIDTSMSTTFPGKEKMLELEKAAVELVAGKLGPSDRLAVVPFFNEVAKDPAAKEMERLLPMSDQNKEKIGALVKVRTYAPGHGTRFSTALDKAETILMERDDVSRAAFIIFLSDGGDDTILSEKEWTRGNSALKDPKYPVHTFGFTNHKADTLGHIAGKTNGTYFPGDIATRDDLGKFAAAFGGLVSRPFSAANARVELASVHPGVSISKIESGEKNASIRKDARSGYVDVGAINAGETTEFTVYMDLPEGEAPANVMEVLAVDGSYTQGWDGKPATLGRCVVVGGYKVLTE
ncbi:hypothetical protein SEVIR_8G107600v4 [Setaria viridis]|uniref:VWFA domain-containing protein n=2 Tax=Setaria TaxID=4554 RepID=K3ZJ50_SETIT|nr:uncharacterized protein LOC101783465 [Setaria italica]XP_034568995.1 uncharacterized protein LOC117833557 [Setaria viridis]RCV37971.1 hypothetical protein SETIT_8G104900v2 [Setaria italica]TKW00426.1 hypothetical protein SEVIR_8G107600v2 [Setaria viridis]